MNKMIVDRRMFFGLAGAAGAGVLLFGQGGRAATPGPAHFAVNRSPTQWKQQLGAARYNILREAGTETPFTSPLLNEHRKGLFVCAGCNQPLFASTTKYDSHTGWPSFWQALKGGVIEKSDRSLMMARTEVECARCGGHLGHVFDDGPKPTGLRYCMNGLAMGFKPA